MKQLILVAHTPQGGTEVHAPHAYMDIGGRANQDEYRTYSGENVWN
ncbi:MAG: hypothetical protein IIB73_01840 [Proteobacteria bacterium]|nr:hypothetical protein [Pseudomonadota bacterium]